MVRSELGVDALAFGDGKVKSVWLALDHDEDGRVSDSQLASFVQKGQKNTAQSRRMRMLLALKRRAAMLREQDEEMIRAARADRHESTQNRRHQILLLREEKRRLRSDAAKELVLSNRESAQQIKTQAARSELRAMLVGFEGAAENEVMALAEACNAHMLANCGGDVAKAKWFEYYKRADTDGSGQICFSEFEQLVRRQLRLLKPEMGDDVLKRVWIALDTDTSGHISAGEFGQFMRKGEAVLHAAVTRPRWQERMAERARVAAAERRAEKEALFNLNIHREMEGAPAASEEDVHALSAHFNARLSELGRPVPPMQIGEGGDALPALSGGSSSWYLLFKRMDTDASGQIDFREMQRMVRHELKLPPSKISDMQLKAAWMALDRDGSGLVSVGEFGAFMRLGAVADSRASALEVRRVASMQKRKQHNSSAANMKRTQLQQLAERTKAYEQRAAQMEEELSIVLNGAEQRLAGVVKGSSPQPSSQANAFAERQQPIDHSAKLCMPSQTKSAPALLAQRGGSSSPHGGKVLAYFASSPFVTHGPKSVASRTRPGPEPTGVRLPAV